VPLQELAAVSVAASAEQAVSSARTLVEAEREHILQALRAAGGKVGGLNGAAARLGMKRTTLQSKMKKLGINEKENGIK
jgi:formate hydrogenlyase transcriptional activator